ncbi:hypothetical protein G5714_013034 [Onychostoma macrolepis]|uniref:Uncharacterized protein n=1 Tax=Onychostoma macrolepis TaxID=369639 RepID=A0A7J6CI20_9TELE|nr:hypothetical protein G5714_013034 [Onychostoma macrolepis]
MSINSHTRQDRGVVPQEQPGLNQEAPSSTEGAETVAEGVSDPITSSPAVGFTEGTVSELAGLVKVLLQSQAARDDRMEQVMVKQDQRWRNMQHQFQQIQHQVLEIQAGGDRRRSQTISPTVSPVRIGKEDVNTEMGFSTPVLGGVEARHAGRQSSSAEGGESVTELPSVPSA